MRVTSFVLTFLVQAFNFGSVLILYFVIIKVTAPDLKAPDTIDEINVIVDGCIKENLIK